MCVSPLRRRGLGQYGKHDFIVCFFTSLLLSLSLNHYLEITRIEWVEEHNMLSLSLSDPLNTQTASHAFFTMWRYACMCKDKHDAFGITSVSERQNLPHTQPFPVDTPNGERKERRGNIHEQEEWGRREESMAAAFVPRKKYIVDMIEHARDSECLPQGFSQATKTKTFSGHTHRKTFPRDH